MCFDSLNHVVYLHTECSLTQLGTGQASDKSLTQAMEVVVSTSLESVSSRRSIILKPEHQGDVKVVLTKHHLPSSTEKEKDPKATYSRADALSRTCKRKSFEMACTKEKDELCLFSNRRRSVPLTGSMKPSVTLVQDVAQHHKPSLETGRNIYHMQQSAGSRIPSNEDHQQAVEVLHVPPTGIDEGLDFQKDNQEHDELVHNLDDCKLLPNWLDNRNREGIVDSGTAIRGGHKSLFSLYDLDLPQVENNAKCKSLFETYHINRVSNSIVDEV